MGWVAIFLFQGEIAACERFLDDELDRRRGHCHLLGGHKL